MLSKEYSDHYLEKLRDPLLRAGHLLPNGEVFTSSQWPTMTIQEVREHCQKLDKYFTMDRIMGYKEHGETT